MIRRLLARVASLAVLLAAVSAAAQAHALGYWNVPGNSNQWWGYGWGAGHHACLVLGPSDCQGCFDHREVRVPYSPQPPYAYYDCGQCNFDFRNTPPYVPAEHYPGPAATAPASAPLPPPAARPPMPDPLPMPEAPLSPPHPLFEAPVER
jgi:hypothetical protein